MVAFADLQTRLGAKTQGPVPGLLFVEGSRLLVGPGACFVVFVLWFSSFVVVGVGTCLFFGSRLFSLGGGEGR